MSTACALIPLRACARYDDEFDDNGSLHSARPPLQRQRPSPPAAVAPRKAAAAALCSATPATSTVAQWSGKGDDSNCWSEAPADVFVVRGSKYLADKKKVASAPALYATVGLDVLFSANENAPPDPKARVRGRKDRNAGSATMPPLAERADSFLAKHLAGGGTRFVLALNFLMPWGSFVAYFAPRDLGSGGSPSAGDPRCDPMLARLVSGDEAYCKARLKLVPHVVVGGWGVKKMVGNKPAIIGKVLRTVHCGKGANGKWCEIQLDAGSNRAARYLIGAASNKGVVMDMGLVLQAESALELPERILGGLRVHRLAGLTNSDSFMERSGSVDDNDPGGGSDGEDAPSVSAATQASAGSSSSAGSGGRPGGRGRLPAAAARSGDGGGGGGGNDSADDGIGGQRLRGSMDDGAYGSADDGIGGRRLRGSMDDDEDEYGDEYAEGRGLTHPSGRRPAPSFGDEVI